MRYYIALALALLPLVNTAQEIQRRSFLGTRLENVTDDLQRIMKLDDTSGVLISDVIKGSTAEATGFKKGDILLKIDGVPVNEPAQAVMLVGTRKGNTKFTYELLRNKKLVKGTSTFKPYPQESYPDLDVRYTQVKTVSGLQRIIISQTKTNTRQPVVVFIGGIGCYSLDSPLDTSRGEIQLLNKLARAGFTTVRIEKPGMGDGAGYGKPCNEIGFKEEVQGYVTAIDELRKSKEIGDAPTYVIGHSMGGVMAPMIGAGTRVDGIIAYGTLGSNFIEYLAKTRRTIGQAYEWPEEETDEYVKDACECASYYFIGKETTEQAAKKHPICGEYLSVFDLRSRLYNDELFAINVPALWKGYKGHSLIAWGESDFISAREDHEIIVNAINRYHSGNGTLAIIKNADHGMNQAASFQEALKESGSYNTEIGTVFLNWLKKQTAKA